MLFLGDHTRRQANLDRLRKKEIKTGNGLNRQADKQLKLQGIVDNRSGDELEIHWGQLVGR